VQRRTFDGLVHGFLRWGGVVDAAGELLAWFGEAARAQARTSAG
jgi:acetyl esterase